MSDPLIKRIDTAMLEFTLLTSRLIQRFWHLRTALEALSESDQGGMGAWAASVLRGDDEDASDGPQ